MVGICLWALKRSVRSVGRDVGEEGGIGRALRVDPVKRLVKEEIRAITLGFFEAPVVANGRVKVGIARSVTATAGIGLADAAGAVDEDFVEAPFIRLIGGLVSQVPLSEDAGGIACGLEHLSDRDCLKTHALSFENRVSDTGTELVAASHESTTRGSTGWANMEIGEANALFCEGVNVRSMEDRIAREPEVSVALVIGHDENDVGARSRLKLSRVAGAGKQREKCQTGESKRFAHDSVGWWEPKRSLDPRTSKLLDTIRIPKPLKGLALDLR